MDSGVVCRGCMRSAKNLAPLLATRSKLRRMFSVCTGVRIERDDALSLHICRECVSKLRHCYEFIDACRKTDGLLREYSTKNGSKTDQNCDNYDPNLTVKRENVNDENEPQSDRCSENSPSCERILQLETNDESKQATTTEVVQNATVTHVKNNNNLKIRRNVFKTKRKTLKSVPQTVRMLCSSSDSIKFVSEKSEKGYLCPICKSVLSSKESLNLHVAEQHSDCKKYVCDYCSKAFLTSKKLTKHLTVHCKDTLYIHSVHPKTYSHKPSLSKHRETESNCQPYACDICNKSFLSRSGMINHSKQHEGDNHLCHLCGQKFTQRNLNVHIRVHTGEKPYVCSVCPFRCSVQSGMRRHERAHYDSRPHTCTVCHKSFNNSGVLVRHRRIHTGELPYECAYCSKAFIDSWKRKSHLVKAHNIPLANIPPMLPGRKRTYPSTEKLKFETENA